METKKVSGKPEALTKVFCKEFPQGTKAKLRFSIEVEDYSFEDYREILRFIGESSRQFYLFVAGEINNTPGETMAMRGSIPVPKEEFQKILDDAERMSRTLLNHSERGDTDGRQGRGMAPDEPRRADAAAGRCSG